MPPPGGMAGMGASFFGFSATMASVVISSPAIEAAFDGDLARRRAERFPDNVDASLRIVVLGFELAERLDRAQ